MSGAGETILSKQEGISSVPGMTLPTKKRSPIRPRTRRSDVPMTTNLFAGNRISIVDEPKRPLDIDGSMRHWAHSKDLPPKIAPISDEDKDAFGELGLEEKFMADHHMIDKKSMLALFNILHSAYAENPCGNIVYKRAFMDLIQLSGALRLQVVRDYLGLKRVRFSDGDDLSVKAQAICFDDASAESLLEKLTSELSSDLNDRKRFVNNLLKAVVWSPWDLVPGPRETTHRLDLVSSGFDDFSDAAESAGLPAHITHRFKLVRNLNNLLRASKIFLDRDMSDISSDIINSEINAQTERVKEICSVIAELKVISKADYHFNTTVTVTGGITRQIRVNQGDALALWSVHEDHEKLKFSKLTSEVSLSPEAK